MTLVSAVVITFNEEKNIAHCIDSLQGVADEILVVDSFSTDATPEICRDKKVRFLQHAFEGYIEQKNFAMMQAQNDFVLALDADERLNNELRNSILHEKINLNKDAYSMNRLNNLCGKWIHHSGWYPDRKIRLWNRRKGQWGGRNPHDKVIMHAGSSMGILQGDLLHYTANTIEQFGKQQEKFAEIAAREIARSGKRTTIFPELLAVFMFLRRYLFQLGILDGYYGFIICSEAAKYTYRKYSRAEVIRVEILRNKK